MLQIKITSPSWSLLSYPLPPVPHFLRSAVTPFKSGPVLPLRSMQGQVGGGSSVLCSSRGYLLKVVALVNVATMMARCKGLAMADVRKRLQRSAKGFMSAGQRPLGVTIHALTSLRGDVGLGVRACYTRVLSFLRSVAFSTSCNLR